MAILSAEILSELGNLDTPTICNAIEVVAPQRRNRGFSIRPFFCAHTELPPIVGYARTARIRSQHKPIRPGDAMGYYNYIAEGGPLPSIVVIDDVDDIPGYGAFWGEVNTNVHYGLGCIGLVSNGSIRDIKDSAENFQMLAGMVNPSHSWVHVVDWGSPVNVHGMECEDSDLIHADMHGACVIPEGMERSIIEEAKRISAQEAILIKESKKVGFNVDKIRDAYKRMAEIH
ncbi:MAG: acyl transferase [Gammaproteobacteria bacterium]|uniref:RraA family protein n=1 Tax=OM182 bacterium TaxID=2510334 RepID=A0A520RYC5_9GAMM|nr:acyl transferase [Gammaproteobacteria bacterium]RZO75174.1 MAG: RraA family protein [OM182 bacterium]